ncbi:MAG: YqcC family protein [Chromatiaceae bacterium]|nr:YqcC family protein [Chromatiaceae bacterium]
MSDIERELHRRGQWESVPPPPTAFESRFPFCCDQMDFTQWLQWVFIPHTRALADAGGPMPEASGIRPMAEEALRDCDWSPIPLMVLLDRFDRMINEGSA